MQGLGCYSLPDAGAGSWGATAYLTLVQGLGCESLPDAGAGSWVATAYLTLVQGLGCCIERGATAMVADMRVTRLQQLTQPKVCKGS